MPTTNVDTVLDSLTREPPAFHHRRGQLVSYAASPFLLRWLADHVNPGDVVLETGAGSSTVALLALGAEVISITPAADEFDRIREQCEVLGVDTSRHRALVGRSQDELPRYDGPALDLALVDGDHAFPAAALDAYYASRHLKQDGILVLDDIQIWAVRATADVLLEQPGWRQVHRHPRFVALQCDRPGEDLAHPSWVHQPYVVRHSTEVGGNLLGRARRFKAATMKRLKQ